MENKFHYPLPRDEVKSKLEAIKKIRYQKEEHLYVFKNGNLKLRFIGEINRVNIPLENLFQLTDSEVVHNHLGNISFSFEDIEMIIFHNIKQLTAVCPDIIYQVTRPDDGWRIDFHDKEILELFESCQAMARTELERLLSQNQISQAELEFKLFHYIWVLFFECFNINYVQKTHPI